MRPSACLHGTTFFNQKGRVLSFKRGDSSWPHSTLSACVFSPLPQIGYRLFSNPLVAYLTYFRCPLLPVIMSSIPQLPEPLQRGSRTLPFRPIATSSTGPSESSPQSQAPRPLPSEHSHILVVGSTATATVRRGPQLKSFCFVLGETQSLTIILNPARNRSFSYLL